MRLSISLLASIGVVGTVAAQTQNEFYLYSGSTNYTTRSTLPGTSDGEICQRYPGMATDPGTGGFAGFFNGIGQYNDAGGAGQVNRIGGMRWVIQDQNGITQEPFEPCIKGDDPLAPGNVDPTNDLVRLAPINTPARTTSGAVAWIYTTTFATPLDHSAAQGDLWACIDVPANPAWTADGLSIHMSGWTNTVQADNPNINATIINFVNVVDQTAIAGGTSPQLAVATNNTRFQRIWFRTPGAVLNVGADIDPNSQVASNPNYGCAGLYPDQNAGRNDGLSFRIVDANLPNTGFTVLGNFGPTTTNPPIPISGFVPGSTGFLYLNLPWLSDAFLTGTTDPTGLLDQIVFAYPLTLSAPVGVMTFQAFGLDFANARVVATNAVGFDAQ